MKQVTFKTLKPSSEIFEVLKNNHFAWWERFKSDPSFYIEIRKNNQMKEAMSLDYIIAPKERHYKHLHIVNI